MSRAPQIPARPSPLLGAAISAWFARRARSRFRQILVRDLETLRGWEPGGAESGPLLVVANHSAWWDAVMPILISRVALRHDAYAMMERRQLELYPFFRRVGVFSVDRSDARSAMGSIDYAAGLLRGQNRVLWIFPQGELLHNDIRPLGCQSGTARLAARIAPCTIVPVAFRYELFREELPTAYAGIGPPRRIAPEESGDVRALTAGIEEMLTAELDRLREEVAAERLEDFRTLLAGRRSISDRWSRLTRRRGA